MTADWRRDYSYQRVWEQLEVSWVELKDPEGPNISLGIQFLCWRNGDVVVTREDGWTSKRDNSGEILFVF